MTTRKDPELTYADVTPKSVYLNRRQILRGMGIAGAIALGGKLVSSLALPETTLYAGTKLNVASKSPFSTTEKQTSYDDVTHYNNYYEFGTDKGDPAKYAQNFRTSPWTVSIEGEVQKPMKLTMDDILKLAPLEERIYRHRCVERWSIVVPWIGYSFNNLVKLAQPTEKAKYVAFTTYFDRSQMPQASHAGIEFPYVEGLRIDEAMNPLTLLCVGMYGEASRESGWRTRPHGHSLEIRLQEHQVSRENPLCEVRASHYLGPLLFDGIWLLFERESQRRSPALEPGYRTPPRRNLHAQDAHVQWLRRPGCQPLFRHGPEEIPLK